MKKEGTILFQAEAFVKDYFARHIPASYSYHSLDHTKETVGEARILSKGNQLSPQEEEIVLLASWFHDIGYGISYDGHEAQSVNIAKDFLQNLHYDPAKIEQVSGCIMATKLPHSPRNLMEQVVCDADSSNLGKPTFIEKSLRLRQEWGVAKQQNYSNKEWWETTIVYSKHHNYFTPYANKIYGEQKQKNIKLMVEQVNTPDPAPDPTTAPDLSAEPKKKKDRKKEKRPERGIETMFRVSLRNHIQLSAIADNKANIMLSINAIIISIVISALLPNFNRDLSLVLPTTILLLVSVVTIIFATISTIPSVTKGTFSPEDIRLKRANLLFFGNFHSMKLEEFESGINEMMKDSDFLYGSMTRDFYYLGQVLNRKYKYLRICYRVFMFGIILSVLAFVVAFIIH